MPMNGLNKEPIIASNNKNMNDDTQTAIDLADIM
jgi:hypothetical protein